MTTTRKYKNNTITQFTDNRFIIRGGGYHSMKMVKLYTVWFLLLAFMAFLLYANNDLIKDIAFPLGISIIGGIPAINYASRYGHKISINQKRIFIEHYAGDKPKKTFKRTDVKSMICTVKEDQYLITIFNIKNEEIQFTIKDKRKRNPVPYIVKNLNLKKTHTSTNGKTVTTRYWTGNSEIKRKEREIKNIGEELEEYRSDYYTITSDKNQLTIITTNIQNTLVLDKHNRSIRFIDKKNQSRLINTDIIASINYSILESAPSQADNKVTIQLLATTIKGKTTILFRNTITEEDPSNMDILDIELDFKNLVAIMDMTTKASIDEDLDTLDLEDLENTEKIIKLKSLDKLKDSND